MASSSIGTALVTVLLLLPAAPASAQQAKCLGGKTGCMAKKATGLLKCEALAETPGKPADPDAKSCATKARTKFDGGSTPAKGCFEKLESKGPNDCLTVDDTVAAETAVETCVAALVAAIDPNAPPITATKCGAGKKKCASKYVAGLLKCRKLAQTPGKPTDPNTKGCVDKAVAKYTGCFAKLEARNPNDCQSTTDSPTVKALAENCVDDLVAVVVTTTTSTTSTTTTTSTTSTPTTTTTTTTVLDCNTVDCNDNIDCTLDFCVDGFGCINTPDDSFCFSNDPCSVPKCELGVGCVQTPKSCDDSNPCTTDSCNGGQCFHSPNTALCDDGLRCTDDICSPN